MPSLTLTNPLTEYGMQSHEPPFGSTIILVHTTEQLYDKATSVVQTNGSMEEWFKKWELDEDVFCHPSFSTFLERIISDSLEEHNGKVNIGDRNITNLRFVDDTDALAEQQQSLETPVENLDKMAQDIRWSSVLRRPN